MRDTVQKLARGALQNAHNSVKQENRLASGLNPPKRPIFDKTRYSSEMQRTECIQAVNSATVRVSQISTKVPFGNTSLTPKNVLIVLDTSNSAHSPGLPLRVRAVTRWPKPATEKKCR